MTRNLRKHTFRHVRTPKIQISLRIRASSMGAFQIAKDAKFLPSDNEDSDQTKRILGFMCLRWAHISEGTFYYVETQMIDELYLSLTPVPLLWGRVPTSVLKSSLTFSVVFSCPL